MKHLALALLRDKDFTEQFVIENILDQVPSRHLPLNKKEVNISEGEFREIKGIIQRNQLNLQQYGSYIPGKRGKLSGERLMP